MKDSRPTILVVGATGTVGGAVARLLLKAGGTRVLAAARTPGKGQDLAAAGAEIVSLDLDRAETLGPALRGIDRALLLTGYSVDMLRQSKRFLDAAREAGVRHVVHVGASGAATNEVAHWGWHQYVERYIEAGGFSFTHLRPEAFMQNVLTFGWLGGGALTCYVGEARWSWVDCDDLAAVAAEALLHPDRHAGKTYPLGYDAKSFSEVAALLADGTGRSVKVRHLPPEAFLDVALKAGGDPEYMRCVYNQLALNATGAIPGADAVFDNFESITGRKPATWADFVARHRSALSAR